MINSHKISNTCISGLFHILTPSPVMYSAGVSGSITMQYHDQQRLSLVIRVSYGLWTQLVKSKPHHMIMFRKALMPKYGMTPEQGVKLVSAFTMLHMWRHMHLRWTLRLLHLWRHLYRHLIGLHLLWHARTRARLHRLLGHRLWHCPTCLHFKKMI